MDDKKLWALVGRLSLEEKAALCSGADFWTTKAIPEKGIPALKMCDGPHGLRFEDRPNRKLEGGNSRRATCFPTEAALACAWDPALARRVGAAIAEECKQHGVGIILGPGVNIKRGPLCGRNFEYYSEDPLLAGELAAGFINGVQENGVGTSLKHYAVNNQERLRMSISVAVDDRALFDLYLKPFEIAIKKAKPDTVMASYNRINGAYATENRRLLNDILRLRFGFAGAVISDWGAVCDRPAGVAAGCELEMPASGGVNDWAVLQAARSGFLSEDALDTACFNLLRLVFRRGAPRAAGETGAAPAAKPELLAENHALAMEAACKSAVLLRNEGAGGEQAAPMLPLQPGGRVAVIGEMAAKPRYQGGGSSHINPSRLESFLQAMKAAGHPFVYAAGYQGTKTTQRMLAAAALAAKQAEKVVLFLGLPDAFECEGYDREHLRLPASQLLLLDTVAAANPNLCVVLCCGAPVEMPWLEKTRAVLCPHLGGQAVGGALVRLLYGQACPGGKLAESWPLALADTPAIRHFPMGPNEVTYNESLFVGYRYYATAQKPVLFPFGFGLSYTRFEYSALALENDTVEKDKPLAFTLTVKNTGGLAGEEIVQAYIKRGGSARFQPALELAAFTRLALAPGEAQTVRLEVPYKDLGFYDTLSGSQVVEAGSCTLLAGPSSAQLPLAADFTVQGTTLAAGAPDAADSPYGRVRDNRFPGEAFEKLYKGPLLGNAPPRKGGYTLVTPVGQMGDTAAGRVVGWLVRRVSRATVHFSKDPAANKKAALEMAADLPFKNIPINTSGILSPRAAAALLELCNGEGSLARLVGALFAKKPYRQMPRGTAPHKKE